MDISGLMGWLGYGYLGSQMPRFGDGLLITLGLAAVAIPGAVLWGLVLVGPRMSRRRLVSVPVLSYIELVRNTPLLLQIYLVYFGLPLIGAPLSAFICGVIAVASQHGAFLAEIYRAGIEAISKHQWDASRALGMRRRQIMRLVILPQAFLKIVPPFGNQLVILTKDTSLVSAIGIMELTLTGKVVVERSGASFEVFLLIAMLYLLLTSSFGAGLRMVENLLRSRY
jgi:polar amino acid transport system permease protein